MKRANLTVPEKLKLQREGYKFFCERHEIDRCAIGNDIGFVCFHASKHKTREGCQYWKPVRIEREDEITRLRAENEKLRGLLREAHVKMDENKLWVNLRRRIAKAIGEWFYNTETGNE